MPEFHKKFRNHFVFGIDLYFGYTYNGIDCIKGRVTPDLQIQEANEEEAMDNNQQNDNRPNGPGGAGQGPNRNRSAFMVFLAITVAVLLGMALFNGLMGSSGSEEISYDKFLEWLDNGYIKSVTVNGSNLEVELKGDALRSAIGQRTVTYYTGNMNDPLLVQRLEKAGVTYSVRSAAGSRIFY